MQNAEAVLNILRERGRRNLPCKELYRQLFNPHLYLMAYGRLYSNHGAMTPGSDRETADGMSMARIGRIIDEMRHERYRFKPARRTYIPKRNGTMRPLGLPSWSDKLVGEVIRILLQAYYEPTFSDRSHGFRPRKGCHSALSEVANTWTGTTWFIEGDISDCFGSLDHDIMLGILGEKMHDNRFLRLLRNMLHAGYLEDWEWAPTLSGAPQGGVTSPILSNIYLDRLDKFVEERLIPQYTRGAGRKRNPAYAKVETAIKRTRALSNGDPSELRKLHQQLRRMPSGDPQDPQYRRLKYVRYADDHLLGFIGPKSEAEEIKKSLTRFLHEELKLELSEEKTLVTHARTGAAKFLGYEITVQHADRKVTTAKRVKRATNGKVRLRVPMAVIKSKTAPYMKRGKPANRPQVMQLDDHQIIHAYGAEYRGLVQFYLLANDVWRLDRVRWVMLTSMLKTLAAKHGSRVTKMARKYATTIETPHGPRRCFEAHVERAGRKPLVARFGGIPLKQQRRAVINDRPPVSAVSRLIGTELIQRLHARRCEWCGGTTEVQVHQVRQLTDLTRLKQPRPAWAQLMVDKRRKTLVVCSPCHDAIHAQ